MSVTVLMTNEDETECTSCSSRKLTSTQTSAGREYRCKECGTKFEVKQNKHRENKKDSEADCPACGEKLQANWNIAHRVAGHLVSRHNYSIGHAKQTAEKHTGVEYESLTRDNMENEMEPIFTDRAAMAERGKKEYGTRENRDTGSSSSCDHCGKPHTEENPVNHYEFKGFEGDVHEKCRAKFEKEYKRYTNDSDTREIGNVPSVSGKKEYGCRENGGKTCDYCFKEKETTKHKLYVPDSTASKPKHSTISVCKDCEGQYKKDTRENSFVPDTGGTSASMGSVGRTTLSRSQMETMGKREVGNVPSTIVELDNGDQYVLDNETDMWIFSKPGERRNSTDELPVYPGLFPTL